jgi:hypothetical protein
MLDSGQGRPWAFVKSFFCFFLHKKAPPFGGAKCLRGAHLHQMRDLVVERV